MCSGEVAMKVWMRGRTAWRTAAQARSMSGAPGTGEAGNRGALALLGHLGHRLEVSFRGDRETRFDDVDPERLELRRDAQLLLEVHRAARRLLAVAQGGVEYENGIGHGNRAFIRWEMG
jgi:hypothetical protein